AIRLRVQVEVTPSDTTRDIAAKQALSDQADKLLDVASTVADFIIGCGLTTSADSAASEALEFKLRANADVVGAVFSSLRRPGQEGAVTNLRAAAQRLLDSGNPFGADSRRPLHWPLALSRGFPRRQTLRCTHSQSAVSGREACYRCARHCC